MLFPKEDIKHIEEKYYKKSMEKESKKREQNQTIDEKHTDMMNIFHVIEHETIPKLQEQKTQLIQTLRAMKYKTSDAYYEYREQLDDIKQEISQLKKQKKQYLLQNSKYIFNYYEEKQKISSGENKIDSNTINSFFKIKGTTDDSSNMNSDKYKASKQI